MTPQTRHDDGVAANPYLKAIEETYPDLESWQFRASRVEEPQQGSELAADNEVFPHHLLSEVARLSLVLAGEHLRFAADAIRARQLYPSAHFTVLRGALVSAAQGVWVLAPDDGPTRQERGLTVMAKMYEESKKRDDDQMKEDKLSDDHRESLREHVAWLETRLQQVGAVRTSRAKLQSTSVIEEALKQTFPNTAQRHAGMSFWRETSSDAHALFWGMFQRGTFSPSPKGTSLSSGTAVGNESKIADPFMCSYRLLKRGWSLFDRRCEGL